MISSSAFSVRQFFCMFMGLLSVEHHPNAEERCSCAWLITRAISRRSKITNPLRIRGLGEVEIVGRHAVACMARKTRGSRRMVTIPVMRGMA